MKVFKDIGKSLQRLAVVFFWIEFLLALFVGVRMISSDSLSTVVGVIVIFGGFIVAWLSNCLLYAFGQLVDDVNDILKVETEIYVYGFNKQNGESN